LLLHLAGRQIKNRRVRIPGTGLTMGIARKVAFGALAVLALLAAPVARADDSDRDEFYRYIHKYSGGGYVGEDGGPAAAPSDQPTVLMVSGVIGPGSYDEFRAAVSRARPEIVVIEGPGGVLGEAILIGEEIRRRSLDTLVAAHRSCASACAVVFLSGHTRYLGAGAVVGLHSASYADGRADPEATQVMAAYLRQVGVPTSTLRRMAQTAPSDIRWLTRSEQQAIGIRAYQ
jgi:membrane-bound ClpP family serine protease